MIQLHNALTGKLLWLDILHLLAMEEVTLTTEQNEVLGSATLVNIAGTGYYVREQPARILEIREEYRKKCVQKLRKIRDELDREDWQDFGEE